MGNQNNLGKVYLVGAGPGAADLITLRGAKLLEQADIVFYDALVDSTILELCPKAIKVAVGKRCDKLSSAQYFINKRLIDAAQKYKIIVRLKGGDPMIFGRADEEIQALKHHGIEVNVVPGITAALAGAAAIQQSLTLRGVSRSVVFMTLAQANEATENTVHEMQSTEISPLQQPNADTLVYYMGRKIASNIAKQLIQGNSQHTNETPVHILEAVSTKDERNWSGTLRDLAEGAVNDWFKSSSPALIMIGEAFREKGSAPSKNIDEGRNLQNLSTKINNCLQDGIVLADGRRSA